MKASVYLLRIGPDLLSPELIYSRDSGLRLNVYRLADMPFVPDHNEIQLFGYLDGCLLAFETVNVTADEALEVISAIQWYAGHMGFPEMEILPEDPRIDHEVAV
ncbi:hypothetical protein [uncultured Mucilaginibacter sp.]|uniref:hypothetical protein n=1 Tax=uncultured Mucilaginibacter sp. TaxID=797541 RepID=UPI0025E6462C|nr:hypothetical protein [uncultured Mucilaginibacter sp.]